MDFTASLSMANKTRVLSKLLPFLDNSFLCCTKSLGNGKATYYLFFFSLKYKTQKRQ